MPENLIPFSVKYDTEPGDTTKCTGCKEPIYGKKYVFNINIAQGTYPLNTPLCESCFNFFLE